jgi:hypothetical protein
MSELNRKGQKMAIRAARVYDKRADLGGMKQARGKTERWSVDGVRATGWMPLKEKKRLEHNEKPLLVLRCSPLSLRDE